MLRTITTITWLTFHEARRRRTAWAALAAGALFMLLFSVGVRFIHAELGREGESQLVVRQVHSFLLLAGLYVVHFLTVMLAIFASVDTVAGEIASHTIQAIVTRPVRRWQVLLGKWVGYALMLALFLGLLGGGVLLAMRLITGYAPPNPLQGLALLIMEALVLVSLSLLGGTRLSTLTNGVALFLLYGLAFIGAWVEQIGALLQSGAAVRVGVISSLLLPVEALWRRAAYLMQPPLANSIPSPFSVASVPSEAMVAYAALYGLAALALALRAFGRRDL
ncbi:MAG TPA: ABC transporter permease subunit [Roseiflexaceae bacterium]|nr:ABC transporter permease subunit [Roseiflexaceae bacterium]